MLIEVNTEFIPIIDYEEFYSINYKGDIFSIRNRCFLKANKDKDGYSLIHLRKKGIRKVFKIHRLVAEYFIGPPKTKDLVVNHKDGVKSNNHYSNLEWISRAENNKHAAKNNLLPKGENRVNTKLLDIQVLEILKLRFNSKLTLKQIATMFGVTISNIGYICSGKSRRIIYESFFNSSNYSCRQ